MAAPESPGTPTLFYDGGSNTAALVTVNADDQGKAEAMKFTDPHAALDWCIAHSSKFVYMLAPPVEHN